MVQHKNDECVEDGDEEEEIIPAPGMANKRGSYISSLAKWSSPIRKESQ